MSIIYKVLTRPADPRVEDSPKRFYPQIVTLGQTVGLRFIAERISTRSSLTRGDISSCIQNFVDAMKEQLLEGKSVNIDGLGVFFISAKSDGEDAAKSVTAASVKALRVCFQANKELKLQKTATRADEKIDLISLDEYLKRLKLINVPDSGGEGSSGGGSDDDQNENPLG